MASIYLSCLFAVQTRCLRKFSSAAFVFVLPRFTAPRRLTKQLNPNPKHLDHMYDLNANPCDCATERAE
jgi:hypothetical protein